MKIWLLNPYGQIPEEGWRDYRFTMLGKALADRGHEVVWWTANFSHTFKKFRSAGWKDLSVSPGFLIRLVPTTRYRRNIGFGRLWFEWAFVRSFLRRSRDLPSPDCIVAIDPPQLVGWAGGRAAQSRKIPLLIDVFDLWPELFALVLPKFLRPCSNLIFSPFYWWRRRNLRHASGLVSLCQTYLDAVLQDVPKTRHLPSLTVFNGIDVALARQGMPTAEETRNLAVRMGKGKSSFWAVYTGSLGNNYDVETLLVAALELRRKGSNISILVLGEGPLRKNVTDFIAANPEANIRYLGTSMKPVELLALYRVCEVALCAYSRDSNVAMPNKAYDYVGAGMPIVNSLRGELGAFLAQHDIGIQYEAGNPASLIAALETLAGDPARRERMAANAYARAEIFDSHVLYGRYAEFIEGMISSGGTTSTAGVRSSVIRKASADDVSEMVKIHLQSFPGFFLSSLGPQFLRQLYRGILSDDFGISLVHETNESVDGFVAGSVFASGLYGRLLKKRWLRFAIAAVPAALRRPSITFRLVRALLKPRDERSSAPGALLMSLAVAPGRQGFGIGGGLVDAFCDECTRLGVPQVRLTTDKIANESTNAFYQRKGFVLNRMFTTTEGRLMNDYVRTSTLSQPLLKS